MRQVTWKSLLITQPLLPRFISRRHPNPKSKTANLADYLLLPLSTKWPCLSDVASSDSEIMPSTAAGAPIYVSSSSESDDQDSAALVPGRNLTPSDFKSYRQAWENSLPRPLPSSRVRTNWREQESACPLPPTEKPSGGSCVSTVCLFL